MDENFSRSEKLLSDAKDFCRAVGLNDQLLAGIFNADSDWAFILQVDALLETSIKEVVSRSLKIEIKDIDANTGDIQEFIEALPVNGRTSLVRLLRAAGCDALYCDFIEATRKVRNSFAHIIHRIDDSLLKVIDSRNDRAQLLKIFAHVDDKNFIEKEFVEMIKKDGSMLRFAILDLVLQFLGFSYHYSIR